MATNKETSVGIKLVADLRNYQSNLKKAQTGTQKFGKNVKSSLGDVKNSFAQLMRGDVTALPGFFKSATTAAGGFSKGLNGVKVALISTGIGAILVGLGLAIAAVTQYFKGTEEGQIAFKKVMNNIKAYTEPVLQMFGKFGKALVHLFKGEFGQAWDTAKGAIAETGEQIKKNTANVGELNAAEEKLIKFKRANLLANKKLEAEIASARLIANNEDNYSATQRQKAINEAITKQKQLAANKREELNLETTIAEIKASFGDNDIATNDQLAQLKADQYEIIREQEKKLMMISETQQRINRAVAAELTARERTLAIQNEQAQNSGIKTIGTRTVNSIETTKADHSQLADMGAFIDANTEKLQGFRDELNTTMAITDQISFMGSAFSQLGGAIGGAAGSFMQMAASILGMVPQLIAQITALTAAKGSEAIAGGVAASQSVPFPFNIIALAATVGSIVSALATKPPALADGGIAFGETLARVGEYSGAGSNPEVIAPLNKLKDLLPGGAAAELLPADVKIMDDHILLSYSRALARRKARTGY